MTFLDFETFLDIFTRSIVSGFTTGNKKHSRNFKKKDNYILMKWSEGWKRQGFCWVFRSDSQNTMELNYQGNCHPRHVRSWELRRPLWESQCWSCAPGSMQLKLGHLCCCSCCRCHLCGKLDMGCYCKKILDFYTLVCQQKTATMNMKLASFSNSQEMACNRWNRFYHIHVISCKGIWKF